MIWHQLPESCSFENDVVYNTLRFSREDVLRLGIIKDVPTDAPVCSSDLPEFEYTSLPDNQHFIRILCLEGPRRVSGYHRPTIPFASVFHAPLDEKTPFFTLSYVWGDPSRRSPIILNDCIFWVTESLAAALERFQDANRILLLWADPVCINQNDFEEKGAQVQQMRNIYRSAQLVLGWIGPTADDSELALRAMSHIGRACAEMPDGPAISEIIKLFQDVLPAGESDINQAFPTTAIVALCSRPWWGRIWVLQEVVLAKTIHVVCGNSSLDFPFLSLAFTALIELPMINAHCQTVLANRINVISPIQICLPRLIEAYTTGPSPQPLTTRMIRATGFGATNPSDQIYALPGMVSDVEELGIVVDYTKSCAESYTAVAAALLQRQQKLEILSRCQNPKDQKHLPS